MYSRLKRKLTGEPADKSKDKKPITILLLTNKNSDNVGDHAIEACDIALIKAAMKNLGIAESAYRITSREGSIVPKNTQWDNDPALLDRARKLISDADVVMFGGAPVINYKYQMMYHRTALTLDLAEELGTPVFFSSIGIESYDEDDPKCQLIKRALNQKCVKRISTRDGYELLEQYKDREDLVIDKAADPAVFARYVFRNIIPDKKRSKKKVGIFVIRHNAFTDNNVDFNWRQAAELWRGLAAELESRGYDYELLSSGYHGDEVMLSCLRSNYGIPTSKSVTAINFLEDLIGHLADYDAVVTCRLHPSILAYSMGIPSVSLLWNPKVRGLYDNAGYPERVLELKDFTPEKIADALQRAIEQGIDYDENYYMSVYRNIFYGLKETLGLDDNTAEIYSFSELISAIPPYEGTSEQEKAAKLRRKFRRIYSGFDALRTKLEEQNNN